jgi:CxxC motif-containing protein (DUF1111 family)
VRQIVFSTLRLTATGCALAFALFIVTGPARGQGGPSPDPGPHRGGAPTVGGPLPGLNVLETAYFYAAKARFKEIDSVTGTLPGETGSGLGPRFNLNGCAGCHAYPAVGGTSPALNPQIAVASLHGARNVVPSFISPTGPIRAARFVLKPDGTADGGVHELFTITGRTDAPRCTLAQPDFAAEQARDNVRFRIPTPLFGLGLVEAVPDANLQAAFAASANLRAALGIAGHFNTNGNDGTITRFGWKAQNKSLLLFAGEAYNVEIGVSNELFPNEIDAVGACVFNASPEDATNLTNVFASGSPASDYAADIVNFAAFSRLSAPPAPPPANTATSVGQQLFEQVGCAACHTVTQTTGPAAAATAASNVSFAPFSDFAVHHMGAGLADGITQGSATGDEFRTAPLWGLGQRLFLLHDGRTADLNQAIEAHAGNGSEANAVIQRYQGLSPAAVSQLLQYLRSL